MLNTPLWKQSDAESGLFHRKASPVNLVNQCHEQRDSPKPKGA